MDDQGRPNPTPGGERAPESASDRAPSHDALLTGDLPCVTCGYELRGLSIRDVCPECGTAVRAAILSAVDPLADELVPLRWPSVTGALIVVWSFCGALGIWLILVLRLTQGLEALGVSTPGLWWAWEASMILLVGSGIGALGFVLPTRRPHLWPNVFGMLGVLAYAGLFAGMYMAHRLDKAAGIVNAYFTTMPSPERIAWRLVAGFSLLVIFLGIRPNARELVRRSLAMRTRRVDRQTLLAMGVATLFAIAGDLLRLVGVKTPQHTGELLVIVGSLIILIATVFLAFGMVSAVIDSVRIRRSLRMGPRRMGDLVTEAEAGAD